jgi:3D (Asp-Asp-Asp) domain-containing protein
MIPEENKPPFRWRKAGLIVLATLAFVLAQQAVLKSLQRPVILYTGAGGVETREVRTAQRTVAEVLREQGIRLGPFDVVAPALDEHVTQGMEIDVGAVERESSVAKRMQTAPVETQYVETLNAGEIIDVVRGQDGLLEVETEAYSLNGEKVFEKVLKAKTLVGAKTSKVIEGTGLRPKLYRLSKRARVRKTLTMEATAYYPGPEDTGKWAAFGRTASNTKAGYGVAAVDPRFIRLKTRLYVEGYGYAEATDVGGAIKGNRIDLCFDTYEEAVRFGRQKVQVYILD